MSLKRNDTLSLAPLGSYHAPPLRQLRRCVGALLLDPIVYQKDGQHHLGHCSEGFRRVRKAHHEPKELGAAGALLEVLGAWAKVRGEPGQVSLHKTIVSPPSFTQPYSKE